MSQRCLSRPFASGVAPLLLGVLSCLSFSCRAKPDEQAKDDAKTEAPEPGSARAIQEEMGTLPPPDVVQKVTNSAGRQPYSGPTATVRGVVRIKGDSAPKTALTGGVEPRCEMAEPMFGRLFREGPGRTLADVLVTVTEYDGYVPVPAGKETVMVRGEGCAWDRRTIALTFGQRIGVVAADRRPYVPDLVGQRRVAELFAMPGADPIHLVPAAPGQYALQDSMRLYSRSDVFVLAYSTHDVTGLDGVYEISGVPVGKAKIGAYLPATTGVAEKVVELEAGKTKEVDLEIEYKADADSTP
jgi:hypothetical protein